MRNCNRSAYYQRYVEGVHELFARDADRRALLEVIGNAIVATQDYRPRQSHQLLGLFVQRAIFVSLRVQVEKSFDAQMTAVQKFLVHFGAIAIEIIHHPRSFLLDGVSSLAVQRGFDRTELPFLTLGLLIPWISRPGNVSQSP